MANDKDSAVLAEQIYDAVEYWTNDSYVMDEQKAGTPRDIRHLLRQPTQSDALVAENEQLREALGWFLNDSRFVVQVGGNPNVVSQMIEAARAALEARGLEIRDKSK